MHASLADQLQQFGGVVIDFIDNGPENRGFTISTKTKPAGMDCGSGSCGSGGCSGESDEHQH